MREGRAPTPMPSPWHVPIAVADVDESGQHLDLVADREVRLAVARTAGLRDLPRLVANFDVTRHGASGLRVVGHVSATVGQECVVTLEPLANEVDEDIDLLFAPRVGEGADQDGSGRSVGRSERSHEEPEPLIGGIIDLGALATEFLILGIDPYPRKPGAVFEPPEDDRSDTGPFAALAKLKPRDGG